MRFCRSLSTWLAPPLLCAPPLAPQLLTAEVDPVLDAVLDVVPCVPELSDCACNAAIMLCKNSSRASAAVVASVLEEDDVEEAAEVEDEDPDEAVLPVVESVPVVDVVLPTPMVCRASMIAPRKPPSGAGGALVLEVAALSPLAVVD
jgi:hypothetical protein